MQTDLNLAKQFALSTNSSFQEFFEDKNDEVRERLFQEFNSLSVVYQKPSERFLKETELKHSLASEKKYFPDRTRKGKLRGVEGATDDAAQADQSTNLLGDVTGGSTQANSSGANQTVEDLIGLGAPTTQAQPAAATSSGIDDLLGLGAPVAQSQPATATPSVDDLLGGDIFAAVGNTQPAAQSQSVPVQPMYGLEGILGGPTSQPAGSQNDMLSGFNFGGSAPVADIQFAPASDCDGEKFQTLWMQLPEAGQVSLSSKPGWVSNVAEIEAKMKEANIFTMASGLVGDEIKFYFHSQLMDGSGYGFGEIVFKRSLSQITGVVKTSRGDLAGQVKAKFESQLRFFAQ